MGFEDREYYRDASSDAGGSGIPGFQFNRQTIITTLIVINVVIFFADTFTPKLTYFDLIENTLTAEEKANPPLRDLGDGTRVPINKILIDSHWLNYALALKVDQPWKFWTFLTNGFAHSSLDSQSGIFHILFNMLTLLFLGRPVEEHLGKAEFLKFYLVAIVIGSIGWYLSQLLQGGNGYALGASGAVSAVVIYFIFLAPQAKLLLFGLIPMPAWGVGVLFLVSNIYHAFSHDSIAWEAHIAGGAFAALYFHFKWNFSRLYLPKLNRANLKVHRPNAGGVDEKLQREADRILAKISEQGQDSLTRRERKTLEKYSAQVRKSRS